MLDYICQHHVRAGWIRQCYYDCLVFFIQTIVRDIDVYRFARLIRIENQRSGFQAIIHACAGSSAAGYRVIDRVGLTLFRMFQYDRKDSRTDRFKIA